jgi:hypothetical protein
MLSLHMLKRKKGCRIVATYPVRPREDFGAPPQDAAGTRKHVGYPTRSQMQVSLVASHMPQCNPMMSVDCHSVKSMTMKLPLADRKIPRKESCTIRSVASPLIPFLVQALPCSSNPFSPQYTLWKSMTEPNFLTFEIDLLVVMTTISEPY